MATHDNHLVLETTVLLAFANDMVYPVSEARPLRFLAVRVESVIGWVRAIQQPQVPLRLNMAGNDTLVIIQNLIRCIKGLPYIVKT